jgi:hypothetical protein
MRCVLKKLHANMQFPDIGVCLDVKLYPDIGVYPDIEVYPDIGVYPDIAGIPCIPCRGIP